MVCYGTRAYKKTDRAVIRFIAETPRPESRSHRQAAAHHLAATLDREPEGFHYFDGDVALPFFASVAFWCTSPLLLRRLCRTACTLINIFLFRAGDEQVRDDDGQQLARLAVGGVRQLCLRARGAQSASHQHCGRFLGLPHVWVVQLNRAVVFVTVHVIKKYFIRLHVPL